MQTSAAFRPGIAQGSYPELREPHPGALAQALHEVRGALARRLHARPASLRAFVASVDRLGRGLRGESDGAMAGRVRDLRSRLALAGPADALAPECFAIVRELAYRTLGTPHYDVQLMAGWVMARGMLAEMETGEGKTLAATLPASAAALAGIPVHVISSNDYLVQRDAEALRPLYQALGLSVGTVTESQRDPATRRAAYACDITYGTAQQIAFDYLRDGLLRGERRSQLDRPLGQHGSSLAGQLLLRGLCFAVIDEADSVLIDEARTPLILSGGGKVAEHVKIYRRALKLARALKQGAHFHLDPKRGEATLTEQGQKRLDELAQPLEGLWAGPRRREEWVLRALCALHLFVRDRHYLVRDEKVGIIDQPTGRLSPDRSWGRGLHQLIEVKERCPVTPERETLASISYQQFFRRYLRLAGMTGTAREVARELWSVYRLNTVSIPTRLSSQRCDLGRRVFAREETKWEAVIERTLQEYERGRPMLIGTGSVAASEHLSVLLTSRKLPHEVLNARQDSREAELIAEAGRPGRVTVATNMAGRGTDIRLAEGIAELGGLHVISTQLGEARRIDRQLFGRCGRQGDPGSFEAILSFEDETIVKFRSGGIGSLSPLWNRPPTFLPPLLGRLLIYFSQSAEERRSARIRRALIHMEEYLDGLLAFSGLGR
jgi:preprotein translocase subunit SecA